MIHSVNLDPPRLKESMFSQNVNEPAIIPLVIATGNKTYPNWVNGSCNVKNKAGGITRRRLQMQISKHESTSNHLLPIHG